MTDIQVDCETAAIVLATLNLAVGMIDKQDLDGSLNEAPLQNKLLQLTNKTNIPVVATVLRVTS